MYSIKINREKYGLSFVSDKINTKWGNEQKFTLKNKRLTLHRKGGPECQKLGLDHKDINSLNIMDFVTLFPTEIFENILKHIPKLVRINGNLFLYLGCQHKKRNRSKNYIQLNKTFPKRMKDIAYKKMLYSTNDIKYRCIHCEENNLLYEVISQQKIQQHCRVHYLSKFQCKECNDSWGIKTDYLNHYMYKCMVCDCNFKGLSSCHNHLKSKKHKQNELLINNFV